MTLRKMPSRTLWRVHLMPDNSCDEVFLSKNLIHDLTKMADLIIIYRYKYRPICSEHLPQQAQPWVHHAEPFVVAGEVLSFATHNLTQPLSDFRAVHIIVIDPILITCVVWRVNINTLHLPCVIWQKRLESYKVVAFNYEVAAARLTHREFLLFPQKMKRHLVVMINNSLLSYPIKRRHKPLPIPITVFIYPGIPSHPPKSVRKIILKQQLITSKISIVIPNCTPPILA